MDTSVLEVGPRCVASVFEVVKRKSATAGSPDGWGWREMKVLPIPCFDMPGGQFLKAVEEMGVWPESLWDAYIATIPKVDGDDTTSCAEAFVCLACGLPCWSLRSFAPA